MTVNFSYRAIPVQSLDLNGGHFSNWPPEHTCINISVSKSLGKMICYDNNKYANLTFDLNGGHFQKWPPEYTCFNISVSNPLRQNYLVSKHTFSGPRIFKKTIINTQI